MNTSQFEDYRRGHFKLLGLRVDFVFKTETSISFDLGKRSAFLGAHHIFGWMDVHHPVDRGDGAEAYLRIALPPKYLKHENRKKFVSKVFEVLEIPEDVVYEALFFTPENACDLVLPDPGLT